MTNEQHIAFTTPFGELQRSTEYLTDKGENRLPGVMTDDRDAPHPSEESITVGNALRWPNGEIPPST